MRRLLLATALLFAGGTAALAEDYIPPVNDPTTAKECGECHMAFQPALLPAGSWHRIMGNLSDHFGENASLPPATATAIESYLTANAGRGDPNVLRITEQRWWRHEHDFSDRAWKRSGAASKIDCVACHRDAAAGLYEDD
ncbi:cytochrome C [Zavarzinia sp.]|uniref:cytochrome C n=1 Tax=Zavarzinia sp. TaxID=2027920 RepID=UPI0035653F19